MTDRTRTLTLRAVAIVGSLLTLGGAGYLALNGEAGATEWAFAVAVLSFAALIWFVAPSQPRNALFWVLAGFLLGFGLWVLAEVVLSIAWPEVELPIPSDPVPPDLPLSVTVIEGLRTALITAGLLSLLTFGLLLFPDGRLPSSRWRWLGYFCGAGIVALSSALVLDWVPGFRVPVPWNLATTLFIWVGPPSCLVSLILRYRRSDGRTRAQIKWIVWGASMFVPLTISAMVFSDSETLSDVLFTSALVVLVASYAIGITKHRLFDIDLVISRTLVYGTLAVFIGVVYVGIVVGVGGAVVGDRSETVFLQILATAIIAIVFQPLRRWLQRLANRVVLGRSATPYEVLSSFSQRVSAVDSAVLTEVARSLADGTTADSASIWAKRGGHLNCIAAWPELPGDEPDPSAVWEPVVHEEAELGRIVLEIAPGQSFSLPDQRLLEQVAGGLGIALRNLFLTEDLKDRVDDLAASRRRIVAVQDETRRKLERDLHDGAQQRLVSLKIKLGIGAAMAEKAGLEDVKSMIDEVRGETDETIESVRDFARGIYPPLLEAEGLGAALSAQARKMPIPVTVQAGALGRFPREHEAIVYFCVLEALQNAMKHSQATSVHVLLSERDRELSFEVRDDGVGFDYTSVVTNGLINMKDRTEAAGGEFKVESEPGRGTTVTGFLPVPELAAT